MKIFDGFLYFLSGVIFLAAVTYAAYRKMHCRSKRQVRLLRAVRIDLDEARAALTHLSAPCRPWASAASERMAIFSAMDDDEVLTRSGIAALIEHVASMFSILDRGMTSLSDALSEDDLATMARFATIVTRLTFNAQTLHLTFFALQREMREESAKS